MIIIKRTTGMPEIQTATGTTIGKSQVNIPPANVYAAEHSTTMFGSWFVSTDELCRSGCYQLIRHNKKNGFYGVMQSSRPDWFDDRDDTMSRSEKLYFTATMTDKALIEISWERLCGRASLSTSAWWAMLCSRVCTIEPALGKRLVPSCIMRGYCKEGKKCCGFASTEEARAQRAEYVKGMVVI